MARLFRWPKVYMHYVAVQDPNGATCLESGWEYRNDAVDRQKELQGDLNHPRSPGYRVKVFASRRSVLDFSRGGTCVGWPPRRLDMEP